jgi:hypothetical protein
MRNGQSKRMRGRNRKSQNPLTRVYESNGPDLKVRGTASHIADKYIQLARDAQASGDPVAAENYYQHAEHYLRLIAAAQEQFRQANPYYRPENEQREDNDDDGDDEGAEPMGGGEQQPFGTREPQPFVPRENQHSGGREHREQPAYAGPSGQDNQSEGERLPAFITGGGTGQQQQQQPSAPYQGGNYGQDGYGGNNGQGDRFPLHRRRRRHRSGSRSDQSGGHGGSPDRPDDNGPGRHRPNE